MEKEHPPPLSRSLPGGKNPVSVLMEYSQRSGNPIEFNMTGQAGPPHDPRYRYPMRFLLLLRSRKDTDAFVHTHFCALQRHWGTVFALVFPSQLTKTHCHLCSQLLALTVFAFALISLWDLLNLNLLSSKLPLSQPVCVSFPSILGLCTG